MPKQALSQLFQVCSCASWQAPFWYAHTVVYYTISLWCLLLSMLLRARWLDYGLHHASRRTTAVENKQLHTGKE